MEYLPSYTDSLYLEHHGIKGQKWGVRRFQNEDGSRTAAGLKRYGEGSTKLRASEKTQNRINKLQSKIDKHDNNVIIRNTVNDYRRGRLSVLNAKRDYQKARENVKDTRKAYKEGNATKKDLRKAKSDRFGARMDYNEAKKNSRGPDAIATIARRQYQGGRDRRISEGEGRVKAVLASAAVAGVTAFALSQGSKVGVAGAKAVGNKIVDSLFDAAISRQQAAHIPRLDSGMITDFKYTVR